MKKDIYLFRMLLQSLEAYKLPEYSSNIAGLAHSHSTDEIYFHLQLLKDCGFVEYTKILPPAPVCLVTQLRITAKGLDFLESIRDDTALKRALQLAKEKLPDIAVASIVSLFG